MLSDRSRDLAMPVPLTCAMNRVRLILPGHACLLQQLPPRCYYDRDRGGSQLAQAGAWRTVAPAAPPGDGRRRSRADGPFSAGVASNEPIAWPGEKRSLPYGVGGHEDVLALDELSGMSLATMGFRVRFDEGGPDSCGRRRGRRPVGASSRRGMAACADGRCRRHTRSNADGLNRPITNLSRKVCLRLPGESIMVARCARSNRRRRVSARARVSVSLIRRWGDPDCRRYVSERGADPSPSVVGGGEGAPEPGGGEGAGDGADAPERGGGEGAEASEGAGVRVRALVRRVELGGFGFAAAALFVWAPARAVEGLVLRAVLVRVRGRAVLLAPRVSDGVAAGSRRSISSASARSSFTAARAVRWAFLPALSLTSLSVLAACLRRPASNSTEDQDASRLRRGRLRL